MTLDPKFRPADYRTPSSTEEKERYEIAKTSNIFSPQRTRTTAIGVTGPEGGEGVYAIEDNQRTARQRGALGALTAGGVGALGAASLRPKTLRGGLGVAAAALGAGGLVAGTTRGATQNIRSVLDDRTLTDSERSRILALDGHLAGSAQGLGLTEEDVFFDGDGQTGEGIWRASMSGEDGRASMEGQLDLYRRATQGGMRGARFGQLVEQSRPPVITQQQISPRPTSPPAAEKVSSLLGPTLRRTAMLSVPDSDPTSLTPESQVFIEERARSKGQVAALAGLSGAGYGFLGALLAPRRFGTAGRVAGALGAAAIGGGASAYSLSRPSIRTETPTGDKLDAASRAGALMLDDMFKQRRTPENMTKVLLDDTYSPEGMPPIAHMEEQGAGGRDALEAYRTESLLPSLEPEIWRRMAQGGQHKQSENRAAASAGIGADHSLEDDPGSTRQGGVLGAKDVGEATPVGGVGTVGAAIGNNAALRRIPSPNKFLKNLAERRLGRAGGVIVGAGSMYGNVSYGPAALFRKLRDRPMKPEGTSEKTSSLYSKQSEDPSAALPVAGGALAGGAAAAAVPAWLASRAGNKLGDALLRESALWEGPGSPLYREVLGDRAIRQAYLDVGMDPMGALERGRPWYARGSKGYESRATSRMDGYYSRNELPMLQPDLDLKANRKLHRKYGRGAVYNYVNRGRLAAAVAGGAALGGASAYGVHRFRNRDQ